MYHFKVRDLCVVCKKLTLSGREREMSYDITYTWNLKSNDAAKFIYKTERDSQT